MSNQKDIRDRLAELMRYYNLNMNSFSKKIGLNNNTIIGKIMQTKGRKPSLDTLELILEAFPKVNCRWLVTGNPSMFGVSDTDKSRQVSIPFYVSVKGGFDLNAPPDSVVIIHGFEDCDVATYYSGDPLSGILNSGDIILCKISSSDIIINGNPYLVVTRNGSVIRFAIKEDTSIRMYDNRLPDVILSTSDIVQIYQVKGCVKRVSI